MIIEYIMVEHRRVPWSLSRSRRCVQAQTHQVTSSGEHSFEAALTRAPGRVGSRFELRELGMRLALEALGTWNRGGLLMTASPSATPPSNESVGASIAHVVAGSVTRIPCAAPLGRDAGARCGLRAAGLLTHAWVRT